MLVVILLLAVVVVIVVVVVVVAVVVDVVGLGSDRKSSPPKRRRASFSSLFPPPPPSPCSSSTTTTGREGIFLPNNLTEAPVHTAAMEGNLGKVRQLVQENPKLVLTMHYDHKTALYYACHNGHVAVAHYLLNHGADINITIEPYGVTLLYDACERGSLEIVRLLLNHGADPTITDKHQWSPLMAASLRGHGAIVKLLLMHRKVVERINHVGKDGETALCKACSMNRLDVVEVLLSSQADPMLNDTMRACIDKAKSRGYHDCVAVIEVRM